MEALKNVLSTFKSRTDLGDFGSSLTKSSIIIFVLSVIAGIPVIFMELGYGFSQSPAKELTPCSAVIVLVTLITSSVLFVTTRRCFNVTKGRIALLMMLEFIFCLAGFLLGLTLFALDKTCTDKLASVVMSLPGMTPRPECSDPEPGVDVARFLAGSMMFVWFLQMLFLGRALDLYRLAKKAETVVEKPVDV